VIRPYLAILRLPHAARLMLLAVAHGLAATATVLPLVFFARDATGSFGGASAVLAGQALGSAAASPVRGRWVDRFGPRRTLPLLALALVGSTALLTAAGHADAGLVVLVPLSVAVGASMPAPGVVLRAIWPRITEGHDRATAFALLTVMHELTNLSGPLIGGLLLLLITPSAALLGCTVVASLATLVFARTPEVDAGERSEPRPILSLGPLVSPGFRAALAVTFSYGIAFGALEDIALPAFAVDHGSRAASGILAAAIALGIAVGGFAFGLRPWGEHPGRLMPLLGLLGVAGTVPALAADSIVGMALLMLVFGVLVAPMTTVQFAVVDDVAPQGSGAEAFSWYVSLGWAGAALGAVIAGHLVDANGWRSAMAVVVAAGAAALLVSVVRRRVLATTFSAKNEPTAA
jgi:MFS family permease